MRLFFFFQAEDGIRDDLVTGVQTCALPILSRLEPMPRHVEAVRLQRRGELSAEHALELERIGQHGVRIDQGRRSEERRVGKGCRARGRAAEYKEKREKWTVQITFRQDITRR